MGFVVYSVALSEGSVQTLWAFFLFVVIPPAIPHTYLSTVVSERGSLEATVPHNSVLQPPLQFKHK